MCFFTASSINEVNDKCYRHDETAPRLISSTFIFFLSLRLVAEIPFGSETRFWFSFISRIYQIIYDIQFSVLFCNLVSNIQLFSVFICQIASHLMFISSSLFSVSSQTLDRTWLHTTTAYVHYVHTAVCSTTCMVCNCILAGFLSSQTLQYTWYIVYIQSGNVRPGLSLRMQLADDRFLFASRTPSNTR